MTIVNKKERKKRMMMMMKKVKETRSLRYYWCYCCCCLAMDTNDYCCTDSCEIRAVHLVRTRRETKGCILASLLQEQQLLGSERVQPLGQKVRVPYTPPTEERKEEGRRRKLTLLLWRETESINALISKLQQTSAFSGKLKVKRKTAELLIFSSLSQ